MLGWVGPGGRSSSRHPPSPITRPSGPSTKTRLLRMVTLPGASGNSRAFSPFLTWGQGKWVPGAGKSGCNETQDSPAGANINDGHRQTQSQTRGRDSAHSYLQTAVRVPRLSAQPAVPPWVSQGNKSHVHAKTANVADKTGSNPNVIPHEPQTPGTEQGASPRQLRAQLQWTGSGGLHGVKEGNLHLQKTLKTGLLISRDRNQTSGPAAGPAPWGGLSGSVRDRVPCFLQIRFLVCRGGSRVLESRGSPSPDTTDGPIF